MSKRFLSRLKRELKDHGVTHDQVASAAKVHRTTVVNTLAGRMKSQNVIAVAERLLAEAKGAPQERQAS